MPAFPSPDDRKVELELRTRLGRIVTELFVRWDNPYIAPEAQVEDGQTAVSHIVQAIEDAAVARGLIRLEANGGVVRRAEDRVEEAPN